MQELLLIMWIFNARNTFWCTFSNTLNNIYHCVEFRLWYYYTHQWSMTDFRICLLTNVTLDYNVLYTFLWLYNNQPHVWHIRFKLTCAINVYYNVKLLVLKKEPTIVNGVNCNWCTKQCWRIGISIQRYPLQNIHKCLS